MGSQKVGHDWATELNVSWLLWIVLLWTLGYVCLFELQFLSFLEIHQEGNCWVICEFQRLGFWRMSVAEKHTSQHLWRGCVCFFFRYRGVFNVREEKRTRDTLVVRGPLRKTTVHVSCVHGWAASHVSDSVWRYGLKHTKLLCAWGCPGKNSAVGCCSLLRGIFPTQEGLFSCIGSCVLSASATWKARFTCHHCSVNCSVT